MAAKAPLVIELREAYHLRGPLQDAMHLPLGRILADPDMVPRGRPIVLRGHGSDADFAARFLKSLGYDAKAGGV